MKICMKLRTPFILAAAVVLLGQARPAAPTVSPTALRTDGRISPTLDPADPISLTWALTTTDPAARKLVQSGYQILAASSPDKLSEQQADLWNSGRIASADSVLVAYAGKHPAPASTAYWKLRVWDAAGAASGWSQPASWHTGPDRWPAKWIGFPNDDANKTPEPAPQFRKTFTLAATPDKRPLHATLFICGLGQYDASLDGQKIGDSVLTPGWSNFARSCLYDTYDLPPLASGKHVLAVTLGNGMYNVLKVPGRYTKFAGTFGPPKLIAELVLDFSDGSQQIIPTDGSWKTTRGPITFNHIYGGEDLDARKDTPGWQLAPFDDASWSPAAEVDGPGGQLVAAPEPPVITASTFDAVKTTHPKPGATVFDFSQNLSGRPTITVKGSPGATLRLVPGELLASDGTVTQRQSGSPVWFQYTCGGTGEETWTPHFAYYGYRYIQVVPNADNSPQPQILRIVSNFTHAAVAPAGTFTCSDQTLNDIHRLINMAILSNTQSVLTDCPHREKLGWLEQSYLVGDGVLMNWDVAGLYQKIARDMREAQTPDGLVPDIAPEYVKFDGGFRDSPEWGSAVVLDPDLLYQYDGDRRTIADEYDAMQRYVAYLRGKAHDHILGYGLGDWFDIGPKKLGPAQLTSLELTGTATYYRDLTTLARMAQILGKTQDAAALTTEAAAVRDAFNARFFHPDTHIYEHGSQTALAMPLAVGLVPDDQRAAVTDALVEQIHAAHNRVTAGDVGFSYVVRALTDAGRGDLLYDMAVQSDGPGYVDQLRKGATSLTEAWDANPGDSQNHLMLGHIEAWFYRGLAGIQPSDDPADAGFAHVLIAPQIVPAVQWVQATLNTPRGTLASAWKKEGGVLTLSVTIPPNASATLRIPARDPAAVKEGSTAAAGATGVALVRAADGHADFSLGSGSYVFTAPAN